MNTPQRGGRSAGQKYTELARAWRRRFRVFFALWLGLAVIFGVIGFVVGGQWKVTFGIAAGLLLGSLAWQRESPPARIQNWQWGSEGERKTAKALRRLPPADWRVWHDLQWEDKTNIDHVVVGSTGVFLLDTKDCFGQITVDKSGLHFQWLEDPDMVSEYRGIFAKEGSASAALKERIQHATGIRIWVDPVVVLWGQFEQGPTEVDKVTFVRGSELVDWLCRPSPPRTRFDVAKVSALLDQAAREGLGPRPRIAGKRVVA
ncbi:MAG: nuclease-related domain-containing protein [Candidatus Dormiibacterota bacterium]